MILDSTLLMQLLSKIKEVKFIFTGVPNPQSFRDAFFRWTSIIKTWKFHKSGLNCSINELVN